MDDFSGVFASNIKWLRNQMGISQEKLGKLLDKDGTTIGKWETGERTPNVKDSLDVANFFNISLNDLVTKDLRFSNDNVIDELEILFNKNKHILTDGDVEMIKFIVEQRKKEIDKEME